jgi:hypothetical protein
MDGRRAITALISSLFVPNDEIRVCHSTFTHAVSDHQDSLLNLLFTIFQIKLPTWKDAFLDGKRLTGQSARPCQSPSAQLRSQSIIERKRLSHLR